MAMHNLGGPSVTGGPGWFNNPPYPPMPNLPLGPGGVNPGAPLPPWLTNLQSTNASLWPGAVPAGGGWQPNDTYFGMSPLPPGYAPPGYAPPGYAPPAPPVAPPAAMAAAPGVASAMSGAVPPAPGAAIQGSSAADRAASGVSVMQKLLDNLTINPSNILETLPIAGNRPLRVPQSVFLGELNRIWDPTYLKALQSAVTATGVPWDSWVARQLSQNARPGGFRYGARIG